MITVIVVAHTFSQYQAFIRQWFPSGPKSADNMRKSFLWLSPMDPTNDSKIAGLHGGIFFTCSKPDITLAALLTRHQMHEARFTRLEDR
jgi:hypothetical protein